jgi:hypothetical protein
MLNEGQKNIFKILHPSRNYRPSTATAEIQDAVETLSKMVHSSSRKSPNKSSRSQSRPHTPSDRNKYDFQGYYKHMSDLMNAMDIPGSPKFDKKPATNPSTPHDLFSMFPKKDEEEGDEMRNMFGKKDGSGHGKGPKIGFQNPPPISIDSPRLHRDALVLSPLFSTQHQGANFFNRFTPTNPFTPSLMLDTRGINFDDFVRPSPTNAGGQLNAQMDKIVDNLKSTISHNQGHIGSENSSGQKSMNLDIELINDTYAPAPLTNTSVGGFKFPSTSKSTGRRPGDFIQSPNSSFIPKKKN